MKIGYDITNNREEVVSEITNEAITTVLEMAARLECSPSEACEALCLALVGMIGITGAVSSEMDQLEQGEDSEERKIAQKLIGDGLKGFAEYLLFVHINLLRGATTVEQVSLGVQVRKEPFDA